MKSLLQTVRARSFSFWRARGGPTWGGGADRKVQVLFWGWEGASGSEHSPVGWGAQSVCNLTHLPTCPPTNAPPCAPTLCPPTETPDAQRPLRTELGGQRAPDRVWKESASTSAPLHPVYSSLFFLPFPPHSSPLAPPPLPATLFLGGLKVPQRLARDTKRKVLPEKSQRSPRGNVLSRF